MRKWFALVCLVVIPAGMSFSQDVIPGKKTLRNVNNNAFAVGEYLKYRIHYGIINAGIAELTVAKKTTRKNRPVFHMVGVGKTTGMAEWFFKTRDRYETYIDTEAMIPWEFIRDVDEGGYKINRHIIFDHYENKAVDLKANNQSFNIDNNAQDLLSTFYYARCINADTLKVGQEVPVDMFLDHEMYPFRFKYLGKETVKSDFGRIRCMKFQPLVQSGRVFKEKEGMTLWVTDDQNKVPIRLESELAVGSIKIDLMEYKNLRHSINFR
ncbi:MAG TPA: DUF3108 domain-containing protein [Cryomorphaceae bacterium]|nr:ATP-dependent exonuclease [Owenweeksia sp.]MBF98345.1 ATP-dependent exonuclease [Owenweeksia sp.]HAD97586.1 DUF3108 domain-containing protein [Cryomorphaceae bacterium]HBF19829.1 DUF3108 domain-containing protein [Cryomorphaceae bacterium]|tara:strand:+ start:1039 stop:1839 length:801 start_codon:yes stop_codon:yes gene_type:complete